MKRIIPLTLALALCLSLAACGGSGSGNPGSVSSSGGGTSSQPGGSQSEPDKSGPDVSAPDTSQPAPGGDPVKPDASQPEQDPGDGKPVLTMNRTEFALFTAGSTFRLRYTCEPDYDAIAEFTSSNEAVATVAEDGTVTAVAPGNAVVTLKYGDLTAVCKVYCRWEEAQPQPDEPDVDGGDSSEEQTPTPPPINPGGLGGGTSTPETPEWERVPVQPAPEGSADLDAFCSDELSKYEFPAMALLGDDFLDAHYPGLTGIPAYQRVHYAPEMSGVAAELTVIQTVDADGAAAVKDILQARVDDQVNGGAWYPATIEQWENNARIVVNGNYVMLIVSPSSDSIVTDFNALCGR